MGIPGWCKGVHTQGGVGVYIPRVVYRQVYLPGCISGYTSLGTCPGIPPYVHARVYLPVYVRVHLPVYVRVHLPVCSMPGYTSLCVACPGIPPCVCPMVGIPFLCMSHGYTSLGVYFRVLYLPGCVPPGVISPGSLGECGPFYARFFGRMWPVLCPFLSRM